MKISIITVVFNNKKTIKDTIESVLSQTYKNIEYIIVDGSSTDGTVEIIQNYGHQIDKFVSDEDNGLYHAMNKGIKLVTGDIIGFLNSDDLYINEFTIEKIVKEFKEKNIDSVYADLIYTKKDNLDKVTRYYDSSIFYPTRFAYGLMPAHPTFFAKKSIYDKYGLFREDFKVSADFEILARFLYQHKISYSYINKALVKMRLGGVSTSFSSLWFNNIEQLRACKINNIKTNIFKIFLKYPIKIISFLRK